MVYDLQSIYDSVHSITVSDSRDFSRRVFNGDESSVAEVHDLLSGAGASYSVDACEPCLVLCVAREAVALVGPFEVEVGDGRVMRGLLRVELRPVRHLPLQRLTQDGVQRGAHLANLRTNVLPCHVHAGDEFESGDGVSGFGSTSEEPLAVPHVHGRAL